MPISTMLMMLETFRGGLYDNEQIRTITLIISQLNLLLCLVQDVLDLKMMELKTYKPRSVLFSPVSSLEFVCAIFEAQCDIQGSSLRYRTVSVRTLQSAFNHDHDPEEMPQQDLPAMLEGDSVRLQQVLINLINNALKSAPNGSVNIYIAYDFRSQQLIVHVQDDGRGIPEEEIPKLFTMFGLKKLTDEENNDGIGLGLLISKNLVEKNGGTISAFSNGENRGAVFDFTMNLKHVNRRRRSTAKFLNAGKWTFNEKVSQLAEQTLVLPPIVMRNDTVRFDDQDAAGLGLLD